MESTNDINLKCRLERIIIKNKDIKNDNCKIRYDTFHDTYKGWIYLSDSNVSNGALKFCKGSSKFNFKRIFICYADSIKHSIFLFKNKYWLPRDLDKKNIKMTTINSNKKDFCVANT